MSRQSPSDFVHKFVREAVNKAQDGPVPEVVLYRLLSVAEAVFRQELEIDDRQLAGLRLGYALEDKTPENADTEAEGAISQKLYWIGWGDDSIYDELLEPERASSDDKADTPIDTSSSALPADVLKELIDQLREEMIRNTPSALLEGKVLRPFVFGHTIISVVVPGDPSASFPIDSGSGGGRTETRFIFVGKTACTCRTPGSSVPNGTGDPCLAGNCN